VTKSSPEASLNVTALKTNTAISASLCGKILTLALLSGWLILRVCWWEAHAMISLRTFSRLLMSAGLLVSAMAVPVQAAQADVDLLQSYAGNWTGRGVLTGAQSDTVNCRLSVSKGNQGKINYSGRCAISGSNLTVAGTIAYIDAAGRYEAAMTSNASFSGLAIGRQQGDGLVFDLRERNADETGNNMTITAQIVLQNDRINVDFNVVSNDSGETIRAAVPFSR
jgi:opacity protein-like surface antigen